MTSVAHRRDQRHGKLHRAGRRRARFESIGKNHRGYLLIESMAAGSRALAVEKARHEEADLFGIGLAGRAHRRELAAREHGEAVADVEEFFQFLRDHQDRDAARREIEQLLADERGRADVDAPGRLRDDQHLRLLENLASDDELLQVAAREALRERAVAAAAHVERLDAAVGEGAHRSSR